MHGSRERYLQAVDRIFQYLKTSLGKGLLFKSEGTLPLKVYVDANYAGSVVDKDPTLNTEWLLSLVVAEFRAMTHGMRERLWIKIILDNLEVLEEEKNLGPHDRLIHVYHFLKDTTQNQQQVQNFGHPFLLVIHEGETLTEVKLRIQKKLQVPNEEFSKWKFAFLSFGRPEYLQDSDIVSARFQRRDIYGAWEQYLGLEHTDNASKRSNAANQLVKLREDGEMCNVSTGANMCGEGEGALRWSTTANEMDDDEWMYEIMFEQTDMDYENEEACGVNEPHVDCSDAFNTSQMNGSGMEKEEREETPLQGEDESRRSSPP
ncbi:Ubiquitin carboxyl-terminal hydrolase 13 [Glycine soja]|uniref:ubiquitinyl hydrolase 1 n=1 Tax=Glycine soja TaxID=3848 RepID=A0A445F1R0_GLYSO|nr:Ubiquitin carboxyl-terminal hydrolase 13 [Glycine soja]